MNFIKRLFGIGYVTIPLKTHDELLDELIHYKKLYRESNEEIERNFAKKNDEIFQVIPCTSEEDIEKLAENLRGHRYHKIHLNLVIDVKNKGVLNKMARLIQTINHGIQ